MKVTVVAPEHKLTFPCVMQSTNSDTIVIFTRPTHGLCIHPKDHHAYGKYDNDWLPMEDWKPVCVTLDSTGEQHEH